MNEYLYAHGLYWGYFVRGVQLHGLAQRGGSIPTQVRFGSEKEIKSPEILQGDADLVLAFEPLEAVRAAHYATKNKTIFIVNDYPYSPVYSNVLNIPYPDMKNIIRRVRGFSKKTMVVNATELGIKEFGQAILGNVIMLGVAIGSGVLPLKPATMNKVIRESSPRLKKENIKAFKYGLGLGKKM